MTTTTKIDEFIRNARASCQSEARAVAECLEDALEGCDGDEHASMTQSIADEFIGWGEAMRQVAEPAVAIQTDQIELSDLAREAMPRGKDDWASERQVAAENEFYANAKNVIAAGAWQRFEDWGLKATTKERINEAVRLAASDPAPPEPEFLDEDNGATLVCDCCGQDVRTNEAHTCRGAIPKIRKVSLRFYLTANMCDNKYTLHVTSDEFGVLRYVFTGGWGDSGMGHCLSNFGLKQPLPATVGDVSVYDLAECIQKILLGGYQKAVDVVFALEIDGCPYRASSLAWTCQPSFPFPED